MQRLFKNAETNIDLAKRVKELEQENNDLHKFIKIIESGANKEKDEFKNRLRSAIRVEYMDFKDVKDMEMSIDLGENFREQLKNIFRILNKHGIVLE